MLFTQEAGLKTPVLKHLRGKGWVHMETPVREQGAAQNKEQKHVLEPPLAPLRVPSTCAPGIRCTRLHLSLHQGTLSFTRACISLSLVLPVPRAMIVK